MTFFPKEEVEHVDEADVNALEMEESVDKDRMYSIIDIICMDNIEHDHIVSSCKILTDGINSILESAYAKIERKKQQQQQQLPLGEPIDSGWEYIYLICETIFNSNYFITFTDNEGRDLGFSEDIFYFFYREMGEYIHSIIHQITTETVTNHIFAIITKFNSLFTHVQGADKRNFRNFIITVANHLPFAFLFDNPVEVEFPTLAAYIIEEEKKIEQDIKQKNIEQEYQFCMTQPGTDQSKCQQYGSCLVTHLGADPNAISYCRSQPITAGGNNYKNNIIKKLKVKKRATKRRQHKSQKQKNRKKHKSQKQKNQRKYKSKNQRKYKSIFNKTLKRKI
jgi:hypothetical protein